MKEISVSVLHVYACMNTRAADSRYVCLHAIRDRGSSFGLRCEDQEMEH